MPGPHGPYFFLPGLGFGFGFGVGLPPGFGFETVPLGLPTLNVSEVSVVVRVGFVAALSTIVNWYVPTGSGFGEVKCSPGLKYAFAVPVSVPTAFPPTWDRVAV